jgi:transposase
MTRATRRRLLDRKIVEQFNQGKSRRWIIKHLKVGDRRIQRVVDAAKAFGYLDGVPLPPFPAAIFPDPIARPLTPSENDELLLPKKDWIKERLEVGWRPITVLEEIGLSIPRSSFYRFLHRHGLFRIGGHYRRVVPEIIHAPGECLQLDWGKLRDVIDPVSGKRRTLWAFIGVLGFSRYMMVRLVWTNDVATTLDAIESMFRELGGVPSKITSDNPKCFALEASNYEPLLNPMFERFASHYGVMIECLPPRDPQKKGKVERMVSYVRRLYEAHGAEWAGLEESQSYMDKKIALANERKHGTTCRRPIDDLVSVESSHLKALPPLAFEREEFGEGSVRQDGHVRFGNKYYSVDENLIGEDVYIIANQKQVLLYHKGKVIEVHERLLDPNRSKQTKPHHLKPWEQAMKDDSLYRKRAARLGPDVERLIIIILQQGQGFIDTRKIWGILSLDKSYPSDVINRACRDAIEISSYSYRTVRSLCSITAKAKEVLPLKRVEKHKFTRSLDEYKKQLELIIN